MKFKQILLLILLLMIGTVACSDNSSDIKSIDNDQVSEVDVMVVSNGVAIKDFVPTPEEQKQIINLHNNATFLYEDKSNTNSFPLIEELSYSNIMIQITSDWYARIVYDSENKFKVIHYLEDGQYAYYIEAEELKNYLEEKAAEK